MFLLRIDRAHRCVHLPCPFNALSPARRSAPACRVRCARATRAARRIRRTHLTAKVRRHAPRDLHDARGRVEDVMRREVDEAVVHGRIGRQVGHRDAGRQRDLAGLVERPADAAPRLRAHDRRASSRPASRCRPSGSTARATRSCRRATRNDRACPTSSRRMARRSRAGRWSTAARGRAGRFAAAGCSRAGRRSRASRGETGCVRVRPSSRRPRCAHENARRPAPRRRSRPARCGRAAAWPAYATARPCRPAARDGPSRSAADSRMRCRPSSCPHSARDRAAT